MEYYTKLDIIDEKKSDSLVKIESSVVVSRTRSTTQEFYQLESYYENMENIFHIPDKDLKISFEQDDYQYKKYNLFGKGVSNRFYTLTAKKFEEVQKFLLSENFSLLQNEKLEISMLKLIGYFLEINTICQKLETDKPNIFENALHIQSALLLEMKKITQSQLNRLSL
jgi:hypothetical protein